MRWTIGVMAGVLAMAAAGVRAQEPMAGMAMPGCTATPAPLPPELAGWAARASLSAAADVHGIGAAQLEIGQGADVALLPTPSVTYPLRPGKPGGSVSHGGLLGFTVKQAGSYRVALGSGAWIDLVRGGKPVESAAHGHGPDCTGVRKMVDFPLKPGRYILQIAGNGEATLPVLVTRLP